MALNRAAVLVVAVSMAASAALAADDVNGSIQNIDIFARRIDLDDGKAYSVQRGINLTKFKVGDKVTLHTEEKKGQEVVTKVIETAMSPIAAPKHSRRF